MFFTPGIERPFTEEYVNVLFEHAAQEGYITTSGGKASLIALYYIQDLGYFYTSVPFLGQYQTTVKKLTKKHKKTTKEEFVEVLLPILSDLVGYIRDGGIVVDDVDYMLESGWSMEFCETFERLKSRLRRQKLLEIVENRVTDSTPRRM